MLITSIKILEAVTIKKISLSSVLRVELEKHANSSQNSEIQSLCYGCLRWYHRLNAIAKKLLKTPLKDKDQDIYLLILLAMYQLLEMRIADYAAVNEAVNAAKKLKKPWAANLVNAVLRNFIRNKEALISSPESDVSLYSHPRWLIKTIKQAWPEYWQEILAANNNHPPMFLRVNQSKTSRATYLEKLTAAGITAQIITDNPSAILLAEPQPINKLPDFHKGEVSVQDAAAQLAAELLELKSGQLVLDACAAPGGKTCHILETQPDLKNIIAVEKDENRIARMQENLTRLSFNDKVNIVTGDAANPNEWFNGVKFDRILIDAPCSATGVIRRHPDIKLLRQNSDIPQYPELQLKILNALWPLLKPQGILVYATCSILPQENVEVIRQFMAQHSDAEHLTISAEWGITQEFGRQIFPADNKMDGFYYAKLLKMGGIE